LRAVEFDLDQIDFGLIQKSRGADATLVLRNYWEFDFKIAAASGEGLPARRAIRRRINALYESVIGKPRCDQIEL
jgi:hypothetical protein